MIRFRYNSSFFQYQRLFDRCTVMDATRIIVVRWYTARVWNGNNAPPPPPPASRCSFTFTLRLLSGWHIREPGWAVIKFRVRMRTDSAYIHRIRWCLCVHLAQVSSNIDCYCRGGALANLPSSTAAHVHAHTRTHTPTHQSKTRSFACKTSTLSHAQRLASHTP